MSITLSILFRNSTSFCFYPIVCLYICTCYDSGAVTPCAKRLAIGGGGGGGGGGGVSIRRVIIRYRILSKPRYLCLGLSVQFDIWQAFLWRPTNSKAMQQCKEIIWHFAHADLGLLSQRGILPNVIMKYNVVRNFKSDNEKALILNQREHRLYPISNTVKPVYNDHLMG